MLLLCLSAYIVVGLLLTSLYWMSVFVGRKHDEEKGYLPINDSFYSGD